MTGGEGWNMNKNNLAEINKIEREIKEVDSIVNTYITAPRNLRLIQFKKRFKLRLRGYGVLEEKEYIMDDILTSKVIGILRQYKEDLIAKQKELWEEE